MKVKVLEVCLDRRTGEFYQPGQTLDLDEIRAEAGIRNGYLQKIVQKKKVAKTEKPAKAQ